MVEIAHPWRFYLGLSLVGLSACVQAPADGGATAASPQARTNVPADRVDGRGDDGEPQEEVPVPAPAVPPPRGDIQAEQQYQEGLSASRRGAFGEAAALFDRACGQGHGRACYRFAQALRDAKGVRADERHAQDLLGQACDMGISEACDAMGH